MRKIGILGYGSVGKFLTDKILNDPQYQKELELAFVWNRSEEKLKDGTLPEQYWLKGELKEAFNSFVSDNPNGVDLVVEVAHPSIAEQYGELILQHSDLMVSSVTAFANQATEHKLRNAARATHALYIPTGAGWGVNDIVKMDELGTLKELKVSMKFNADALKLREPLKAKLEAYLLDKTLEPLELYKGDVRTIAGLAPNNVNTMTCLALAAQSIGLDKTEACLIAQKEHDAHIVEIEAIGPNGFAVKTTRYNPAKKGAVTGSQTYYSFLISLLKAQGKETGLHFC